MRKNMQKRTAMLALTFVFALVICGAVAAADNTTATDTNATVAPTATTNASSTPTSTTPATDVSSTTPDTSTTDSAASTTDSVVSTTGPSTSGAGCVHIIGGGTFTSIQCAVQHAICGDTIVAGCGVYNECVTINPCLKWLSIIGLPGAVVVGGFDVQADKVTIQGFTIVGGKDGVGIKLDDVIGCKVLDNTIVSCCNGIELDHANFNCIKDNVIKYNTHNGIDLDCSEGNTIECNTIESNVDGVSLYNSEGNWIKNNEINCNFDNGVELIKSDFNNIVNNEINKNYVNGINLCQSNGNVVKCNDIINNRQKGLLIDGSKGNIIVNNKIKTCVPFSVCIYVKDFRQEALTGDALVSDENCWIRSDLNEIHYNSIIADGPFTLAIVNNGCERLNAQCNWFGCNRDPCCLIGGSGVTLYCPWLTKEPANCGRHVKKEKKTTTTTTTTQPASVTTAAAGVPMQTTGAPLALLALALLAVFGGLIPKRK